MSNMFPEVRNLQPPLTRDQLAPLAPECRLVQFCSPLSFSEHKRLADFLQDYPQVTLRIYGYYGKEQGGDLAFLKYYPSLLRLQIDIFELSHIDGIEYLPENLQSFGFGATRRTFSLEFLKRFRKLIRLNIEGHKKDIATISTLKDLEHLTLRSITIEDLSILIPLKRLWWLALKLGGTNNLGALPQIQGLKYLELWRIRGLDDLSPISRLTCLQCLFIQDLKNVRQLPDFSDCDELKTAHIQSCKGIVSLRPLLRAKNLEELDVRSGDNFVPSDFTPLRNHSSLKRAGIGLGSLKKNEQARNELHLPDIKHPDPMFTC